MKNIYVKRNVQSLSHIGSKIGNFIKRGTPILIKYGVNERDIIIRFQQKLDVIYEHETRLTNDDYPPMGYVLYTHDKMETYKELPTITTIARFELIYDMFGFKLLKEVLSDLWSDIVGDSIEKFNNRERW